MVNREATPLIIGILIPLLLVSLIALRMYGFDAFIILAQVDVLYYIVLFPIVLGLVIAILNRSKK